MIRLICILVVINIFGIGVLRSQYLYDNHFVMGYWSDTGSKDPIVYFTNDQVKLKHDKLAFGFIIAGNNISDAEGNLLLYMNGCDLANGKHEIVENGSGFNPGRVATSNCPYKDGYTSGQQSILILPADSLKNEYIIFHDRKNIYSKKDSLAVYSDLNYSVVDVSFNDGHGKVKIKNKPVLDDTIVGGGNLTAVKHRNGKDWWIIKPDYIFSNNYYKILLSGSTILSVENQNIGKKSTEREGGSQASFSPDGKKYMRFAGHDGLFIMDFDRATGDFSNFRNVNTKQEGLFSGASFSPNGRFVYLGNGPHLYQVDLESDSLVLDTVAIWDGSLGNAFGQPNWFGQMQIGPDCRIYGLTGYCLPYMHMIMEPNKKGKACDVRQHILQFDTPVCNLPHFPNFRLDTPYAFCNPEMIVLSSTEEYHFDTALNKVSISPNPTNGLLTLSCKANIKDIGISDMSGRTLFNLEGNNTFVQEIDISSLQRGVYFIRIVYGKEHKVSVAKVIKVE